MIDTFFLNINMEKFPMCRICLVKNVPMYALVNKNLHELYEKLTDVPFVTEDSRPILVCFFCCTKLKQCFQLHKKCLQAEELFAQMMDENYKPKPVVNHDRLGYLSGFIKTPMELISIVDNPQKEIRVIKEEFSAECENIIEAKDGNQSLEPENVDNSTLHIEYTLPHRSESHSIGDVPLMRFKMEVEEELEVSKNKRRAIENVEPENVYSQPLYFESDSEGDGPLIMFKVEVEEEQEIFKNESRAEGTSNINYIATFSRGFIFELWLDTRGSNTDRRRQVTRKLADMMPDADNLDISNLENVAKQICERLVVMWRSSHRVKRTVLKKRYKWLCHRQSVNLPRRLTFLRNTSHITGQPSSLWTAAAVGQIKKEFRDLQ